MSEEKNREKEIKNIISSHIFMFSFKIIEKIDQRSKRKEYILKNQNHWEEYKLDRNNPDDENLRKYLNKYVKNSLFRYNEEDTSNFAQEFEYKNLKDAQYIIQLEQENSSGKYYTLELEKIRIKFFDTSVGIISFFVNNKKYNNIEDVLLINNLGRKLYAAYDGENCPILSILNNGEILVEQDIGKASLEPNGDIEKLKNNIVEYFINTDKIDPVVDDRMYVMSHYLAQKGKAEDRDLYWYQYIFIDEANVKSCCDEDMERELLKKATYSRWRTKNTLYGVSRYSFTLWTDDDGFPANTLNRHIKYHYYQLFSFLIAQRATILRLNDNLNNILQEMYSKNVDDKIIEDNTYREYLIYLAKLNFKEISCQEQGIELYKLCREQMELDSLNEELNLKIKTLNDALEKEYDKEENENNKKLNNIVLFFTIFGLLFAVLGISEEYIKDSASNLNWYGYLMTWIKNNSFCSILLVIVLCVYMFFIKKFILKNRRKNDRK